MTRCHYHHGPAPLRAAWPMVASSMSLKMATMATVARADTAWRGQLPWSRVAPSAAASTLAARPAAVAARGKSTSSARSYSGRGVAHSRLWEVKDPSPVWHGSLVNGAGRPAARVAAHVHVGALGGSQARVPEHGDRQVELAEQLAALEAPQDTELSLRGQPARRRADGRGLSGKAAALDLPRVCLCFREPERAALRAAIFLII